MKKKLSRLFERNDHTIVHVIALYSTLALALLYSVFLLLVYMNQF